MHKDLLFAQGIYEVTQLWVRKKDKKLPNAIRKNNKNTFFFFTFNLIMFALMFLYQPETASAMQQVEKYKTHELILMADSAPANPFDTYLLKLEITDPSEKVFTIDGFFDGDGNGGQDGKVWKARICPYETGTWSWRTVTGDAVDAGLAGLSGTFEVTAGTDIGGVVGDGQFFQFQNGEYVYLQGNFLDNGGGLVQPNRWGYVTHVYMSENVSDSTRDDILTRQRDFHNVNKINVYFANKDDYGGDVPTTPWVGSKDSNDKTKMDLARWKLYDDYIRSFKDNEMFAEMWFFADDSNFGALSTADKNRLFRYAMARTSAFSHTMYVIALEWREGWSQTAVTEAGDYIQAHNPWGRVLSVHDQKIWYFSGESWATFIATQAGNGSNSSEVNQLAIDMRNNEDIPHIDEEFGVLFDDSDTELRANVWANFCGGSSGGGTGSDLKAFVGFLTQTRVPFQRMYAANNLVSDGGSTRFVLAEERHHYVVYSEGGSFTLEISDTGLLGKWFDPRNPDALLSNSFDIPPGTQTFTPPNNTSSDWVLWITNGTNLNSGIMHPTTGATLTQEIITTTPLAPVTGFRIIKVE